MWDVKWFLWKLWASVLLTALIGVGGTASAQISPGDFINPDNATKVKDLVSPGVYARVLHGMTMKITPTERIDWPPPYREATEKYSAQVRLSPDRRSLVAYAAGQPFPIIDPNDPDVGAKIMWDNTFRPISSDDYDLRDFACTSEYWGKGKPYQMIDYIEVGHYAGYNLVGRTEVEPIPIDPDFKTSGRYWLFGLYPVLAPQQARGTGILRYRYADPLKGDDQWDWTPGTRRLRRLNETILGTATGAQEYSPDNYEGFSAKNENYDFKFIGEKNMLAAVNSEHVPEVTCNTDGGASVCPERWEMRHLYIVEARALRDRVPEELYSRRVLYIDSEAIFVMYLDMYDRRGSLWKNYTSWMTYRDRPVPAARIAIYPFKREFQVGSSTVDVQSGFSSVCYHPAQNTAERDSWYINMGAVDRQFFTLQAMVKAAP